MSRPPRSGYMIPPAYVEGDTCSFCWRWISPGSLFKNRKAVKVPTPHGDLIFCDEHCKIDYQNEGCSLYEAGVQDGMIRARKE